MALRLFRRRSVPVPTLAGMLVLSALVVGTALLLARVIPGFLAPDEPIGRGVFVVEGWMDGDELRRAADTYRRGRYEELVVTGGPILDAPRNCGPRTYAERAAAEMRELGIVEPALVVMPSSATERDRTYRSALEVRRWLESLQRPASAVELASHGPHARRSRALYRLALGEGVEVGVLSVLPSEYDLTHWWRSSEGVKDMLAEATGYAWMLCCFHPDLMASSEPVAPIRPRAP